MIDETLIVNLINERFDDVNARIDDLKRDVLGTAKSHSEHDDERFDKVELDLSEFKKIRWMIMGIISGGSALSVTALQKVLEHLK